MIKNTLPQKQTKQTTMFGTYEFPSYEEIMDAYAKEFANYILPKGDTTFGFWMQTLADLEFLDLELQGLTDEYSIDPVNRVVNLKGDEDFIKLRIAHLEKVKGKRLFTLTWLTNLEIPMHMHFIIFIPTKVNFYPRIVRTLINAFKLNHGSILLDPFNGSGTAKQDREDRLHYYH